MAAEGSEGGSVTGSSIGTEVTTRRGTGSGSSSIPGTGSSSPTGALSRLRGAPHSLQYFSPIILTKPQVLHTSSLASLFETSNMLCIRLSLHYTEYNTGLKTCRWQKFLYFLVHKHYTYEYIWYNFVYSYPVYTKRS